MNDVRGVEHGFERLCGDHELGRESPCASSRSSPTCRRESPRQRRDHPRLQPGTSRRVRRRGPREHPLTALAGHWAGTQACREPVQLKPGWHRRSGETSGRFSSESTISHAVYQASLRAAWIAGVVRTRQSCRLRGFALRRLGVDRFVAPAETEGARAAAADFSRVLNGLALGFAENRQAEAETDTKPPAPSESSPLRVKLLDTPVTGAHATCRSESGSGSREQSI